GVHVGHTAESDQSCLAATQDLSSLARAHGNFDCTPEVSTRTARQNAQLSFTSRLENPICDLRNRAIAATGNDQLHTFFRCFSCELNTLSHFLSECNAKWTKVCTQIASNSGPRPPGRATS